MRESLNESGVSEVVGTVLLIALVVLGAAVVAAALLSQPRVTEVPHASIVAGENGSGNFVLVHEGGDALSVGEYRVYVDDGTGLKDETDNFTAPAGGVWSLGENITYKKSGSPERVVVTAVTDRGETILAEPDYDGGEDNGTYGGDTGGGDPGFTGVLNADFKANVTSGKAPLAVQFIDLSTGDPTAWAWNFGDGVTSTEQYPVHTYTDAGTYTVILTATNDAGSSDTETKIEYITVSASSFIDYVIDRNVFVYGNVLDFQGGTVTGPGSTVIITGGLDSADLNGGASVSVSNIYIDGNVTLDGGSAGLGSATEPGNISVNGNLVLWKGTRNIYGDVYVNGDFSLKDANIYNNVYVNGDLTLGNTPWIADDARIYYTGTISHPNNYNQDILAKCIHQTTVPAVEMPDQKIPSTKSADWYAARGYVSGGDLTSGIKIYADSYAPTSTSGGATANNVIIIARDGDIDLSKAGWISVTGVLFAPNGKVTFSGSSFEGVVIARDGFFVTSGSTTVTFKNIEEYISDPNDYPF